jgi:hypothetical protein
VEKSLAAKDAVTMDSEKIFPIFVKDNIFCANLSPPNNSQACYIELMLINQ